MSFEAGALSAQASSLADLQARIVAKKDGEQKLRPFSDGLCFSAIVHSAADSQDEDAES